MFTDRVNLNILAGKGGDGLVAWRREKFLPKGGPSGGNGGSGGSIIVRASSDLHCLEPLRDRRKLKAQGGTPGGPNQRQGKRGADYVVTLPCGTLIKDTDTEEILGELLEDGQEMVLAHGGRGGRGNASFKTSKNRAPFFFTKGKEGEERCVEFELKLIADVGLVGFPNAGKSTFIRRVAKVPVKVAPYPFTTLRPHLGMIESVDCYRILIADIPGIIKGASENRGLGLEFLRHIERTKVLVFTLDASGLEGRSPLDDFMILKNELLSYGEDLLKRPYIVLLNKIDCPESKEHIEAFYAAKEVAKNRVFEISALEGKGLKTPIEALFQMIHA